MCVLVVGDICGFGKSQRGGKGKRLGVKRLDAWCLGLLKHARVYRDDVAGRKYVILVVAFTAGGSCECLRQRKKAIGRGRQHLAAAWPRMTYLHSVWRPLSGKVQSSWPQSETGGADDEQQSTRRAQQAVWVTPAQCWAASLRWI